MARVARVVATTVIVELELYTQSLGIILKDFKVSKTKTVVSHLEKRYIVHSSYCPSCQQSQKASKRSGENGCAVSCSASIRNIDFRPGWNKALGDYGTN